MLDESMTIDKLTDEEAEARATGQPIEQWHPLPWETSAEREKFHYFLLCPGRRSVRNAYKAWCEAKGIEPKKNPPSSWYQLYQGRSQAIRLYEKQMAAIERAGEVHGRYANWERLEAMARTTSLIGQHGESDVGQMADALMMVDLAFHSLAIDLNGDPIPEMGTWDERTAAFWDAVERGEVPNGLG